MIRNNHSIQANSPNHDLFITTGGLYIKIQNLVTLKVAKLRGSVQKDKAKHGHLHWCVLGGEIRVIIKCLITYGIDPQPSLSDESAGVVLRGATQFIELYNDAVRREATKEAPSESIKSLYNNIQTKIKMSTVKTNRDGIPEIVNHTNAGMMTTRTAERNLGIDRLRRGVLTVLGG